MLARGLLAAAIFLLWSTATVATESLAGKLLVATPDLLDPNFAATVIFLVEADEHGAMGLVVNRVAAVATIAELLAAAGVATDHGDRMITVHYGGPVRLDHGFVLHGADYADPTTIAVGTEFAMSPGTEVLDAIGAGAGPARFLFALGYAGWGPGQLESEIQSGSWFIAPANPDLVFAADVDGIWRRALGLRTIEL